MQTPCYSHVCTVPTLLQEHCEAERPWCAELCVRITLTIIVIVWAAQQAPWLNACWHALCEGELHGT